MKKLLALLLAICMVLCLCACGADKNGPTGNDPINNQTQDDTDTSSVEETSSKFTVKVVDQNGDPVSNVMVQICQETCLPKPTDANGVAIYDFEYTDGHKLSLFSCPEGYETEYVGTNYIILEDDLTEYTFEITKK